MSYYLKPEIKMEPLIWSWYAWPYLIPPITAGCNVVDRHLKIMESYIESPEFHKEAVLNPQLIGGPFIDLDGEKIDEINDLIKRTKSDCKDLIILQQSMKDFDRMFQSEAKGDTLDGFYGKIPLSLKGLIELVYDLNHHPSIKYIEPLIYNKYYSNKFQKIALSESVEDERKFVLSTPRIEYEDEVYLNIPFSSKKLDQLFEMRTKPNEIDQIMNMFSIPETKLNLFRSFFTSEKPSISSDSEYLGEDVRVRYFGHACVLIQTKELSILIDPVISYSTANSKIDRYTFLDLPDKIDYVLITHNHQDHFMFEALLQLRYKIKNIVVPANQWGNIVDPSLKLILKTIGFNSIIELKEMESISIKDGEILGIPFFGEHSDLNIQTKLSYLVQLKGKKLLFAADSNNLDSFLYDHIFAATGNIDILFLGMECDGAPLTWLYGPLLTQPIKRDFDRNRSLSGSNFNKAWEIVKKSQCKEAYIYAMGQEPWLNYVMALKYDASSPQIIESNKLLSKCKEEGIVSERLFGKKEWII